MSRFQYAFVCFVTMLTLTSSAAAACLSTPGDLNGSGSTDVVDIQCHLVSVLAVLNTGPAPACLLGGYPNGDSDCDGNVTVTDVTFTITLALGAPLSIAVDANGDDCADSCQFQGPACLNEFDLGLLSTTNSIAVTANCASLCLFQPNAATCLSACVATEIGTTAACSACFGEFAACSINNCLSPCSAGATSPTCLSCQWAAGCSQDFAGCSGIFAPSIPPQDACANPDDQLSLENANEYAAITTCIASCSGTVSPDVCIAGCFALDTGVSGLCTSCYVGTMNCAALSGCQSACQTNVESSACKACLGGTTCLTLFESCAGHPLFPPPPGACTNSSDQAALGSANLSTVLSNCAVSCAFNPNPLACATSCFQNAVGTSTPCTACFATATSCGSTFCLNACLGGLTTTTCKNCLANAGCSANFEACAGIPFPL